MKIRFIIVDDAAFLREVLKDIMTSVDSLCVGESENGEDAVKLAATSNPDMIFLDMVLPRQNGIDTARQIKRILPSVKIIGCSTIENKTLIENALDAGFDSYIKKPFTKDQILSAVRTAFPKLGELRHG